ncbi:hypothetical protein Prudu_1482S000400 [Prunus dulcis]|uniref:Uncharacterized protein n=1 Tax=Prunus dulcis TaxID=3755 RepID=A0A5H2XVU5_PRUDU|nr:hypothetical protein Prudu_1482S000400 [Prunus dulcis]
MFGSSAPSSNLVWANTVRVVRLEGERIKANATKGSVDERAIIVLDRYKVKLPASSFGQETYLAGFETLIANMFPTDLTFDATAVELNDIKMLVADFKFHVQKAASKNDASLFRFLRYHPLLQGSRQRFIYPIATLLLFEYRASQDNLFWSTYNTFPSSGRTIDILGAINGLKDFEEIYNWGGRTYINTPRDELEYIRNVYTHINRLQGVCNAAMNEERIEHDLSQLFPKVLTDLWV